MRSLESAVRKYNLPLTVHVVSAREGMVIGQANILGMTLNIIDTHEDSYVKGNTIVDGKGDALGRSRALECRGDWPFKFDMATCFLGGLIPTCDMGYAN